MLLQKRVLLKFGTYPKYYEIVVFSLSVEKKVAYKIMKTFSTISYFDEIFFALAKS